MESVLLVIHVIIALGIVALIMLQQGKGAEMGASFGAGSSQTVFGAAGSGNFFSRMTGVLVAVFFASSITLAVMSKTRVDSYEGQLPVFEEVDTIPAAQRAPADEIPQAATAPEASQASPAEPGAAVEEQAAPTAE